MIAVHFVLGLLAAVWVVQTYNASRKLTFQSGPPSPNRVTRAIEHKVQMAKKQSTMTAPAIKRIVSAGIARSWSIFDSRRNGLARFRLETTGP